MQDARFDPSRFIAKGMSHRYTRQQHKIGATKSRTAVAGFTTDRSMFGSTIGGTTSCGGSFQGDQGINERCVAHFINPAIRPGNNVDCSRFSVEIERLLDGKRDRFF